MISRHGAGMYIRQVRGTLRITVLMVAVALAASGCKKEEKELEQTILRHDPSFQDVLDNRNDLREQIALQRAGYEKKASGYDSRIAALKEQKALARNEYDAAIGKIKRQIEPAVRQMKTDIVDMRRRLDLKRIQMRGIERDIKEIEALIDKKDTLAFTSEEIKTWNDRLAALIESKAEVSADEHRLEEDIRVTKLKLKVMKL